MKFNVLCVSMCFAIVAIMVFLFKKQKLKLILFYFYVIFVSKVCFSLNYCHGSIW